MAATTGSTCAFAEAVAAEHFGHFFGLDGGHGFDLAIFPGALGLIMLGIGAHGQVTPQAHRDRPGRDFGQAGRDDDGRRVNRPRQPGGQRKWHRQSIRHADHDVAHHFGGGEMFFDVRGGGHGGLVLGR